MLSITLIAAPLAVATGVMSPESSPLLPVSLVVALGLLKIWPLAASLAVTKWVPVSVQVAPTTTLAQVARLGVSSGSVICTLVSVILPSLRAVIVMVNTSPTVTVPELSLSA